MGKHKTNSKDSFVRTLNDTMNMHSS